MTDFPPIDPGSIITPANISLSSVAQPATPPGIIVSVYPATPTNIEEPQHLNIPENIISDHPNERPANPVLTDDIPAFINQDDVLTGLTTASTVSGPIPAVVLPTPVTGTTHAPLPFDVAKDGAAAAAKTSDSSKVASLPDGGASILNMPRVCMSLISAQALKLKS